MLCVQAALPLHWLRSDAVHKAVSDMYRAGRSKGITLDDRTVGWAKKDALVMWLKRMRLRCGFGVVIEKTRLVLPCLASH